jgi:mercuric ion binding protein
MKQLVIVAFLISTLVSCMREEKRVLALNEGDKLFELSTPTAGCEKCQKIMEEGLGKIKGVNQSILNLNTKKVSISYSPNVTDTIALKNTVVALTKKFPCK